MVNLKMNNRGLIKIVEAVVSIMIIFSVLLLLYGGSSNSEKEDLSKAILPLLEEIASNNTLREIIITDSTNENAEEEIIGFLGEKIKRPDLDFDVKICDANIAGNSCALEPFPKNVRDGNVYSQSRIISTYLENTGNLESKRVRIFLWRKI